ncbi:hypothetical protein AB1Y20_015926 [Prymnesium parvum]|uniref:Large ribosomal subunit protein uL23m n=1 Tax=Prymnesium parvum TaxID=97485 RepID=A0AB34JZ93_PRYPA
MVNLFPNWIVKHVRKPRMDTDSWLKRPVETFIVSPKMTKMQIKEYLRKLYQLPVTAVHTINYLGKMRIDPKTGRKKKDPDYKKAYVFLKDNVGAQKPRYMPIQEQLRQEAMDAWPAKPESLLKLPGRTPAPGKEKPSES